MPRPQMKGPGSMAMGGGGKKPRVAPTGPIGTPSGASMAPPKMGSGMGGGSGTGPGAMGPRSAPGSGTAAFKKGGEVRPGKKEREEEKKEHKSEKVMKHEHGGPIAKPTKQETAHHHMETAKHHVKEAHGMERVAKHAHGGPVIAGHGTHGLKGHEHPKEQGISKGSDGRRGGVKGAGLESISSQTSNAKARVSMHKKAT